MASADVETVIFPLAVIIFDDHEDPLYRELMREGAEDAGGEAYAYSDPRIAAQEVDRRNDVAAIIATLGWHNGVMRRPSTFGQTEAQALIAASNRKEAPRAIVSDIKEAGKYIRSGTRDIVIPFTKEHQLGTRVSDYLGSIFQQNTITLECSTDLGRPTS